MTNREIDAMVAEKVMGWVWRQWKADQYPGSVAEFERRYNVVFLAHPNAGSWSCSKPALPSDGIVRHSQLHKQIRNDWRDRSTVAWDAMEPPHYSTDIAAAWQVVEKVGLSVLYDSPTKRWQARQHVSVYDETASKWCDTAPRAICLAALKAVGVEVPA